MRIHTVIIMENFAVIGSNFLLRVEAEQSGK